MAINDQATVNPPVPVTILNWRVKGCMKQLHNQIKIIEIERQ